MCLEFCTSDKQVVLLPSSGDVDALVLPRATFTVWFEVLGSSIFSSADETANWYSRRKFPFAASSAACNFLFAHLHILTSYQSRGCEITFPCCSVRFPDTVLPCIPWSFEFLHWYIAFSSLDLWILLLTSMCCVCVCVWAEECFCGQISEKHVFSSCALSLSSNSIHSLFCQILFSTCNVATFVSIFLHGAGFSVSHCKTASPSSCDKNILPNFICFSHCIF